MALRLQKEMVVSQGAGAGVSVGTGEFSRVAVYYQLDTGQPPVAGTVQVQISADDTFWVDEGAALTDEGFIEVTKPCLFVRINTTVAMTGGSTRAILIGQYGNN